MEGGTKLRAMFMRKRRISRVHKAIAKKGGR